MIMMIRINNFPNYLNIIIMKGKTKKKYYYYC